MNSMFKCLVFVKKNLLWFITGFVMFIVVFFLMKDTVLSGDDIWLGFYGDWKYIFLTPEHGRFLQSIQMKTLCYWIPSLLNIHPNAMSYINAFIVSFDVVLLCFITALFGYIGRKKSKMVPILALGVYIYYSNILFNGVNVQEIRLLSFHFAYIFGLMMFLGFWLIFGEILFAKEQISTKKLVLCSIFAFFAAMNDTYAYIGIISLFFASCTSACLILKETLKNHNFVENIKNFFKKYYALLSMGLCYCLGGAATILTTYAYDSERFMENSFSCSFSNFYNLFLPQFLQACVFKHYLFVFLFAILFASILFIAPKKEKILFYSCCLSVGVFGFFMILFFGGMENFYEKGKFWIWHADLQNTLTIILLAIDIALWGFLAIITKYKKVFRAIAFVLLCTTILIFPDICDNYRFLKEEASAAKKQMYMSEKMYLFYTYKKEMALLPLSSLKHYIASTFYLNNYYPEDDEEIIYTDEYRNIDILEIPNFEDRELYAKSEETAKSTVFKNTWFRTVYTRKIYNILKENSVYYMFADDDVALKKFYQNGGTFTVEELQKLDFTKLMDKNFVLNQETED